MNKGTAEQILAAIAVIAASSPARGDSYYFPKFGTPIVMDEFISFSEPGLRPHRIICVTKDRGIKLWEISSTNQVLKPWLATNGKLIITRDSEIVTCDSKGKTELVFDARYDRCALAPFGPGSVLVSGTKTKVECLSLVDLAGRKLRWEIPHILSVVAQSSDVVLCQRAERKYDGSEGYTYVKQSLIAISAVDGTERWHYPSDDLFRLSGLTIGGYFVVTISGRIHVIDPSTGVALNTVRLSESSRPVSLTACENLVLAWTQEGDDWRTGHVAYSFTIPGLAKNKVAEMDWYAATAHSYKDVVIGNTIGRMDAYNIKTGKKLWEGGQWAWSGIHDGWIYFSEQETNGTHSAVSEIEVSTGTRRKLYEELLPENMQEPRELVEQLLRARVEKRRIEEHERLEKKMKQREDEQRRIEE